MSTLGLTIPIMLPPIIPQRLHKEVPSLFVRVVGRQGMNFYRTINGSRTIQDIARLFGKSEMEVMQMMRVFQRAGYVRVEVSAQMRIEDRIACTPTLIMPYSELGLANQ